MATNKTQPTGMPVNTLLTTIEPANRRDDAHAVCVC